MSNFNILATKNISIIIIIFIMNYRVVNMYVANLSSYNHAVMKTFRFHKKILKGVIIRIFNLGVNDCEIMRHHDCIKHGLASKWEQPYLFASDLLAFV